MVAFISGLNNRTDVVQPALIMIYSTLNPRNKLNRPIDTQARVRTSAVILRPGPAFAKAPAGEVRKILCRSIRKLTGVQSIAAAPGKLRAKDIFSFLESLD